MSAGGLERAEGAQAERARAGRTAPHAFVVATLFSVAILATYAALITRVELYVVDDLNILNAAAQLTAWELATSAYEGSPIYRPLALLQTEILVTYLDTVDPAVIRWFPVALVAIIAFCLFRLLEAASTFGLPGFVAGLLCFMGMHTSQTGLWWWGGHAQLVVIVALLGCFWLSTGAKPVPAFAWVGLIMLALAGGESGIVVAGVVIVGHLVGTSAISRRAAVASLATVVGYLALRFWVLDIPSHPAVGYSETSVFGQMITPEDQAERYRSIPAVLGFYAYNVSAAAVSVLFSIRDHGRVFATGLGSLGVPAVTRILSASLSTGIIVAYMLRWSRLDRRSRELSLLCVAAIAGNTVLSFLYVRDRIMHLGGTAYAVLLGLAVSYFVVRIHRRSRRGSLAAVLLLVCVMSWAPRYGQTLYLLHERSWETARRWLRPEFAYLDSVGPDGPGRYAARVRQRAAGKASVHDEPRWLGRIIDDAQ